MAKIERTEEQKLFQDGVKVTLGGKEYTVKPLKIRAEREWRQKLSELLATLPEHTKVTTDTPEKFGGAIRALLVSLPDQVTDLFFDYAIDLKREEIEEVATGAEVAEAFQGVIKMAFPLPQALTKAMTGLV
jgi:hypothetical protein